MSQLTKLLHFLSRPNDWPNLAYDCVAKASRPLWSSVKEVLFTLIVSNFALLLAVFMHVVDTTDAKLNADTALKIIYSGIKTQEILAYVLAIIAAPLWIMVSRWKARRHAALFFWVLALQSVMVLGSTYIFARAKFGSIANSSFTEAWAKWCLLGSIFIWLLTLFYQKLVLENSSETLATPSGGNESGQQIVANLRSPQ